MNKLEILKKWYNDYQLLSTAWDNLEHTIGAEHDSPLGKATWGLFDNYTDNVAELVGDKDEWLVWYCWENRMGTGKLNIRLGGSVDLTPVCSLEDLLKAIEHESKV